jgi:hypothetical protein
MFTRPSNREIYGKVADALVALRAGRFQFGPLKHLSGDLAGLQLASASELPDLLIVLLEEIQHEGPITRYAGTRPPQRSYEPQILNLELWAYSWHSPRLRKPMYLKYALKNQCYIHVDCHEDRPPERLL